jgi:Mn2+/Fe2+ NRAMP family transporter
VGVSHLVQSTRAGAGWGWTLVPVVLAANLLKYPFFEFAPRYTAATGRSLLEGYAELGRWALATFLLLCLGNAVAVVGAVAFFSGSLAALASGGGENRGRSPRSPSRLPRRAGYSPRWSRRSGCPGRNEAA